MNQTPTATPPPSLDDRRRRFTSDEYRRMAEVGILRGDDGVELIDGEILTMPPIGGPHASAVIRLVRVLAPLVQGRADLSVRSPVRLQDGTEPRPDLALLVPRDEEDETTPTAGEALLLAEVAVGGVAEDRRTMRPRYARCRIPELWIVDLNTRTIVVCRSPAADAYASMDTAEPGQVIGIAALPGIEAPVRRIVGRSRP